MSETCECHKHGIQPVTFVCKHILTPQDETEGFFSYESQHTDDLRNAWCEDCEAHLQARKGEWVEDSVQVPDGFHALCSECYRVLEAKARTAGRRFIHRS